MKQSVALLGVGTMGAGMAANLLKAGFPLAVWNRSRAKVRRRLRRRGRGWRRLPRMPCVGPG